VERRIEVRGAAHLVLVEGASLLAPSAQVFEAMLDGWRSQQLSRNLAFSSIDAGARTVRRFQEHADEWPWQWTPGQLEGWCAEMRERRVRARTTVRSYQLAVRSFLTYVVDPVYGWDRECLDRFGTHAVQIAGPGNTAVHVTDYEGDPARRALTRTELQALFDAADDTVAGIRSRGRKGWLPAFRDATMLKVAYGWGLRRHELVMLEAVDWGSNPKAAEFGPFGVCYVRWGKASHGSAPRRRSVLTVMGWAAEVIGEWVTDIWPHTVADGESGLWPSERRARVSDDRVTSAFSKAASDAGLPSSLSLHCLRHSYATHLLEDGFDALFVQQQLGHQHASTTSIYTSVSSDYKTGILRQALDRVAAEARNQGGER
jgi:integrase/recombinase XerC